MLFAIPEPLRWSRTVPDGIVRLVDRVGHQFVGDLVAGGRQFLPVVWRKPAGKRRHLHLGKDMVGSGVGGPVSDVWVARASIVRVTWTSGGHVTSGPVTSRGERFTTAATPMISRSGTSRPTRTNRPCGPRDG